MTSEIPRDDQSTTLGDIPSRQSALKPCNRCMAVSLIMENSNLLAFDVQRNMSSRLVAISEIMCKTTCGLCWEDAAITINFTTGSTGISAPNCSFVQNLKTFIDSDIGKYL